MGGHLRLALFCAGLLLPPLLIAAECTSDEVTRAEQVSSAWHEFRHEVRAFDYKLLGMSEHGYRFVPGDSLKTPGDGCLCEWRCSFTNCARYGYGGPVVYGLFDSSGAEMGRDSTHTRVVSPGDTVTVGGSFALPLVQAEAAREARWWFTCGGKRMGLRCMVPGEFDERETAE